jgi:uncharacterized protein (TIGR02145 family)
MRKTIFNITILLFITIIVGNSMAQVPEEKGVVINGVKWATRNVDKPGTFAANPEDAGMFYQWNKKVGWSATDPMINSDGGTTWDTTKSDGDTWENTNDPCPTGWRVPTKDELQSLIDAGSEWTILNGINGRTVGNGNNSLFLSAAGCRSCNRGMFDDGGTRGGYWSSSPYPRDATGGKYHLGVTSGYIRMLLILVISKRLLR